MPLLPLPPVVRHADDLLSSARTLLDDFAVHAFADPNVGLTCGPRCTACCHQAVPASPAEVRSIVAAVAGLEPDHRARIERRVRQSTARLAAAEIGPSDFVGGPKDIHEASLRYFSLGLPCPLLDDQLCSVHPDRPLACREYLVASNPVHCSTIDNHPERVVHIRASADVKAGFRQASAALGEPDLAVLAFALADAVSSSGAPPAPATEPRSGPSVAAMLTPPRN